jgi:hypothetical protein
MRAYGTDCPGAEIQFKLSVTAARLARQLLEKQTRFLRGGEAAVDPNRTWGGALEVLAGVTLPAENE